MLSENKTKPGFFLEIDEIQLFNVRPIQISN
jgi:hypothetical protein